MTTEIISQNGVSMHKMHKVPEMCAAGNEIQNEFFRMITEKYPIPWYDNDVVLDVGCSTGDVTKLMVHNNLIDYAAKHHTKEQVNFVVEGAASQWPAEWDASFTKIVSFHTLHFVDNQEQFMRNAFKALQPGGAVYVTYPMRFSLEKINKKITSDSKWSSYLPKADLVNTGDSSWKQPENYRVLLEKAGFRVQHVTEVPFDYVFPDDDAQLRFLREVNYMYLWKHIPSNLIKEFEHAYLNEFQQVLVQLYGHRLHYRLSEVLAEAVKPK